MQSDNSLIDMTTRMQALTREYSRYSRSAGGLSAVGGGVVCIASYLAGGLLPITPVLRIVLVAMPLIWLVGKQWLAHRYYQRFGHVEELTSDTERRYQHFFVGFTALVSLVIMGSILGQHVPFGTQPWDLRVTGYLGVVLALPFVVWRWLRTPLEFIVGAFLLCQAALAFGERAYGFGLGTVVFPLASVALIARGLHDHGRFLRLQTELRCLIATPQERG